MKILHLSSERSWRGGERQISFLIDELSKAGVENKVLSKNRSSFSKFCSDNHIAYEEASFANDLDIFTALKIKNLSKNYDFVHAHTARGHGLAVFAAKLGMKTPIVVTKRTVFPIKNPKKYTHSSIAGHIAISKAVKEVIVSSGVNSNNIEVIYSSVDLASYEVKPAGFKERKKLAGKFCIANTSALTEEKDYETFFKVAKLVVEKHPNTFFIAIGEGDKKEFLNCYVRDLGISDNVIFTGFIHNVKEVLSEMDLFCMTSTNEGLGSSLLDAMALKLPIVATNAGGMKELVINGETGFSCDVGDEGHLAMGICNLIENNDLRQKFIANSSNFLKKFSIEKMGQDTLNFYQKLAK